MAFLNGAHAAHRSLDFFCVFTVHHMSMITQSACKASKKRVVPVWSPTVQYDICRFLLASFFSLLTCQYHHHHCHHDYHLLSSLIFALKEQTHKRKPIKGFIYKLFDSFFITISHITTGHFGTKMHIIYSLNSSSFNIACIFALILVRNPPKRTQ